MGTLLPAGIVAASPSPRPMSVLSYKKHTHIEPVSHSALTYIPTYIPWLRLKVKANTQGPISSRVSSFICALAFHPSSIRTQRLNGIESNGGWFRAPIGDGCSHISLDKSQSAYLLDWREHAKRIIDSQCVWITNYWKMWMRKSLYHRHRHRQTHQHILNTCSTFRRRIGVGLGFGNPGLKCMQLSAMETSRHPDNLDAAMPLVGLCHLVWWVNLRLELLNFGLKQWTVLTICSSSQYGDGYTKRKKVWEWGNVSFLSISYSNSFFEVRKEHFK